MRKTSYAVTFIAVVLSLILNIVSTSRIDWVVVKYPEILNVKITLQYGLTELCERTVVGNNTNYSCRKFPLQVKDKCEEDNQFFCSAWTSAGYCNELGIGFASLALFSILIGVSTHSRRRRIWRASAGLILLHAVFQCIAFSIVTDMFRRSLYPTFEQGRLSTAYVLNTVSWVYSFIIGGAVIVTGISADKGHRWAAGNRAYQPIQG